MVLRGSEIVTVQNALTFIGRQREQSGRGVDAPGWRSLDELLGVAKGQSLSFTEDELREAFRIDWSMRFKAVSNPMGQRSSSSD
jgi:hypothetical protein